MPYSPDAPERFLSQAGISITITGLDNLRTALTHPTYGFEAGEPDNQRLEFLGDAVLGLIVADKLFREHPDLPEGELTRHRARLVCEDSLALAGGKLGLGSVLRLGKGEAASGGAERPSNLADALEAVIGALYLEGGLELAGEFVKRSLLPALDGAEAADGDYKTRLQEEVQKKGQDNVTYAVLEAWGPDHDRNFRVGVYYRGGLMASGSGKSKKDAEQEAAKLALANLEHRQDLS